MQAYSMTTKNFMVTIFVTGGAGVIDSCYVLARCAVGDDYQSGQAHLFW